jgi:hypothetical protein
VDRYVVLERRASSDDMVSSRYFEGFRERPHHRT